MSPRTVCLLMSAPHVAYVLAAVPKLPRPWLRAFAVADAMSAGLVTDGVLRRRPLRGRLAFGLAFDVLRTAVAGLAARRGERPLRPVAAGVAGLSLAGAALASSLLGGVDR